MPIAFLLRWSEIKEKKRIANATAAYKMRVRERQHSNRHNRTPNGTRKRKYDEKDDNVRVLPYYYMIICMCSNALCKRYNESEGKKYARIVHMLKFVTVCLILLPFSHRTHTHFSFARWFFFSFVMLLLFNTNTRTIFKLRWILCILIYEAIHSHRYFYLYGVQLNEKKK